MILPRLSCLQFPFHMNVAVKYYCFFYAINVLYFSLFFIAPLIEPVSSLLVVYPRYPLNTSDRSIIPVFIVVTYTFPWAKNVLIKYF